MPAFWTSSPGPLPFVVTKTGAYGLAALSISNRAAVPSPCWVRVISGTSTPVDAVPV